MADEKISKELTWKGLKMELEAKELQEIFQQVYEEDEYYNYDILISGLYKALNKEVPVESSLHLLRSRSIKLANSFTSNISVLSSSTLPL